jgi:hypothetical protein
MGDKNSGIDASLETWEGSVKVNLEANGDFYVTVGDKYGSGDIAISGNVGDDERRGRYIIGPDGRVYKSSRLDNFSRGVGFQRFRPIRMTRKVQELYRTHVLQHSA